MLLCVISVAIYFGSLSTGRGMPQLIGTVNATNNVKRAASIDATPEGVTVDVEPGRSEVRWDTGDGSVGFIYVSANGGERTLFARGPTGSRTARWIRPGPYVFELYRDAERRTLLAA